MSRPETHNQTSPAARPDSNSPFVSLPTPEREAFDERIAELCRLPLLIIAEGDARGAVADRGGDHGGSFMADGGEFARRADVANGAGARDRRLAR